MNKLIKIKTNRSNKYLGITIFEIVCAIFIITVVVSIFAKWVATRQIINQSNTYAEQSHSYAIAYIKYLSTHESAIFNAMPNGSKTAVTIQTLDGAGYLNGISQLNIYGQTPCLIINKNSNGTRLFPILIFTDGKDSGLTISGRSMQILGGYTGIYNKATDTIEGDLGQWSYPNLSRDVATYCRSTPANNSLALNLGMMTEYSNLLATDLSLHRIEDVGNYELGNSHNSNTMLTDMATEVTTTDAQGNSTLINHKIYMSNNITSNNPIYLSESDNKLTANATDFHSNSLQPSSQIVAGTSCLQSEIGSIVHQKIDNPDYEINTSNLICTYSPPICQAQANNDYCYLPEKYNKVTYNLNNRPTASTTFICPAYTPTAINGTVNPGAEVAYYYKCNNSNIYDDCKNHISNAYKGSGDGIVAQVSTTGNFITSNISANNIDYSINVGYNATGGTLPIAIPNKNDLSNCSTICMSATGVPYNHLRTDQAQGSSPICACEKEGKGYYYAIYKISNYNPHPLQSVTCTNKIILTQN